MMAVAAPPEFEFKEGKPAVPAAMLAAEGRGWLFGAEAVAETPLALMEAKYCLNRSISDVSEQPLIMVIIHKIKTDNFIDLFSGFNMIISPEVNWHQLEYI